jgi:protein-S-isoprenylcysteine O-methyltransferase Ste14
LIADATKGAHRGSSFVRGAPPHRRENMTVLASKVVWLAFAVGWGAIRYRYARRARRNRQVEEQDRSYEIALLTFAFAGYLGVPALYLATSWLSFADYSVQPILFWAGVATNLAAIWLFWRSHADLGRNFSMKLVIREQHALVTDGVYRLIRHPMYASFLLWSLGQLLLLPNWVAGSAGLLGFSILYFPRIDREEKLMLKTFGDDYHEYILRTKRLVPYVH